MREKKKARIAARGWKIGGAMDFLGLSAEEAAYVELELELADGLRRRRRQRRLTQAELARRAESSRSRVAKTEAGDPPVALDLLIRSLLALGATNRELARIITLSEGLPAT